MSEYKIVNRVHPTPAFAQTVAEVEAQAQAELDKSLPLVQEVAQNPEVAKVLRKKGFNVVSHDCAEEDVDKAFKFLEVPQTAEASRAPFVGQAEDLKGMLDFVRSMPEAELAIVSKKEFEDFKERVIRAFKDMGFDTRKFFDE